MKYNKYPGHMEYALLIDDIIAWCFEKFGMSKFHDDTPFIEIVRGHEKLMGEYRSDSNTVIIYYKYIRNIDELISTVIHEYTHFLQSPGWYTRYFNLGYNEDDNPYEIIAEQTARHYTKICKKELGLTNRHLLDIANTKHTG